MKQINTIVRPSTILFTITAVVFEKNDFGSEKINKFVKYPKSSNTRNVLTSAARARKEKTKDK
jgi:hypothetical protein